MRPGAWSAISVKVTPPSNPWLTATPEAEAEGARAPGGGCLRRGWCVDPAVLQEGGPSSDLL